MQLALYYRVRAPNGLRNAREVFAALRHKFFKRATFESAVLCKSDEFLHESGSDTVSPHVKLGPLTYVFMVLDHFERPPK
ncbi:hypothetical protein M8818_002793 [Zalaria obscura]|uniref:Uncharacterized protein n=1 Tax=Zalaria obscura TaxID=2024903 RepID=A0ACC3SIY3_9PEZI